MPGVRDAADPLFAKYGGWAVVTGASSGLGEEYAIALARRGFPVALVARRADRLESLAANLRAEHGVATRILAEDLADPAAPARVATAMADVEVGILVNNAGFGFSGRFADADPASDARMVQVNCGAVAALTHAFLPPMLGRRRGAIVIVASIAAYQPTPFFAIYGATKAFDLMLAESLWCELRGTGVDVLSVNPGRTRTEFSIRAHYDRPPDGDDPRAVVEGSLVRLPRQSRGPSYVPGAMNWITTLAGRFFTRAFTARTTGRVLARELLRSTPEELRARPPATPSPPSGETS